VSGLLALSGCSAGPEEEADGPPDFTGSIPMGSGGQTPSPAAPANPSPAPGANAPTASAGEQNPASGAPIAPGTNSGNPNNGSGNPNTSGANSGAGGASMVGGANNGNVGAAGSVSMGSGGSTGEPPVTPPQGEEQPPVTPPPVVPLPTPVIDTDCPDGAFFCSGFEQATFPAGTVNIIGGSQFADAFRLDRTQFNSGQQAFFLPLTSQAFSYRVMAIPVPVQAFWARIFVRTDTLFGDVDHDGIFAISSGDQTVDNNNETRIEFAEQEGTIVLNRSTDRITFPTVRPKMLAANTWHCVETRFDGAAGDVEVFADGQAIISALGDPQFQFVVRTFRIGTLQFHAPRNVWFDDVVLDTQRIGCN
jgi:hypothetical protein